MNNTTMTNNAATIITAAREQAEHAIEAVNSRLRREERYDIKAYKTKKAQGAAVNTAAGMNTAAREIKNEQTAEAVLYTALKRLNQAEEEHEFNKTKRRSDGNPAAYQSKTAENEAANRIEGRRDILALICAEVRRSNEPQKLKDQAAAIEEHIKSNYGTQSVYA